MHIYINTHNKKRHDFIALFMIIQDNTIIYCITLHFFSQYSRYQWEGFIKLQAEVYTFLGISCQLLHNILRHPLYPSTYCVCSLCMKGKMKKFSSNDFFFPLASAYAIWKEVGISVRFRNHFLKHIISHHRPLFSHLILLCLEFRLRGYLANYFLCIVLKW